MSDWENEFEEMIGDFNSDPEMDELGFGINTLFGRKLKAFISDLLAKEQMELVSRIEGMKKQKTYEIGAGIAIIEVYNQALDDVISILKSEEKEEVRENENV